MALKTLLVANRGEIAIRIVRAAAEMGIGDRQRSFRGRRAVAAHPQGRQGRRAQGRRASPPISTSRRSSPRRAKHGCDAIHPGYGFLSENAAFARACAEAGLTFVGPAPETLELFGDKAAARALARRCERAGPARHRRPDQPGGGPRLPRRPWAGRRDHDQGARRRRRARHARRCTDHDDLAAAYERCRSEAQAAFGNGDVYVERLFPRARHIEVQIVGDGTGAVTHLWERECSVQRQRQKLIEIAPAPGLRPAVRERLLDAAVPGWPRPRATATSAPSNSWSTPPTDADDAPFAFIEANPRLQVEHTVTEEVTGIDLVQIQLEIAGGATLADLGLMQASMPAPRGMAIQSRVNMETHGRRTAAPARPAAR